MDTPDPLPMTRAEAAERYTALTRRELPFDHLVVDLRIPQDDEEGVWRDYQQWGVQYGEETGPRERVGRFQ